MNHRALTTATLLAFAAAGSSTAFAGERIYVDAAASGTATGATWADACTELSDALAIASAGDEIWIASGVYFPSTSSDAMSFTLLDGMSIHGGFAGGETELSSADPTTNITVLSGDIDGDDTVDAHGVTLSYSDQGVGAGNTAVPLVSVGSDISATLSGLVICGGEDSGITALNGSDLTISNCAVRGNSNTVSGGGLDFTGKTLTVTESSFLQNYATNQGGGIRCDAFDTGQGTFDRCIISGNVAGFRGGGLTSASNADGTYTFRDSLLTGNNAIGQGGALHTWTARTVFNFINCTIASNNGGGGGQVFSAGTTSRIEVRNSIVWSSNGGVKTNGSATYYFESSIIEGSGGSTAWNSAYGTDGGNNLDVSPEFISAPAYWSAPTLAGDFTLDDTSPAIHAGDNSLTTSTTDLAGNARIFNFTVDLGAYENQAINKPTFTLASDLVLAENSGTYAANFASDIQTNDPGQSIVGFNLSVDNAALFSVAPTMTSAGYLEFTLAADTYGSAVVTVTLSDDGETENQSAAQTFTITVLPATITWDKGATDQLWTSPANWSDDTLPTSLSGIDLSGDASVTLNDGSSQNILGLSIGGENSSDSLTLTADSTLNTEGTLSIATVANSTATLTVSDGASWTHTLTNNDSKIGFYGGTVDWTMSDGASFAFNDDYHQVNVAGTGSDVSLQISGSDTKFNANDAILNLGNGGDFSLTVSDGAHFGSDYYNAEAYLKFGVGSSGTVSAEFLSGSSFEVINGDVEFLHNSTLLVDDASVIFDTTTLYMEGNSSLTVQNGGSLQLGSGIEYEDNASFSADNATLDLGSVNLYSPNAFTLKGGTQATALTIATHDDTQLLVEGSGTSLTLTSSSQQYLSRGATLTISDGASFAQTKANYDFDLQRFGNSTDTFLVTGSGSTATFAAGLFSSRDTATSVFRVEDGASASFADDITLTGTHAITVTGSGSSLNAANLSLSSTNALIRGIGDSSSLSITGNASLGGTLTLQCTEDFTPSDGESFILLSYGSLTDNGYSVDTTVLPDDFDYTVSAGSNALTLTATYIGDTVDLFRSSYGLAADGSDDEDDWSGNGVANIFYHTFDLGDPNEANIDHSRLPSLTESGDSLLFSYLRRMDQGEVEIEAVTNVTTGAEDSDHLRITYTFPIANTQRFFSVRTKDAEESAQ